METWTDIPGFEGYYQVSNLQRIKSLNRSFIMERDIFDRWSIRNELANGFRGIGMKLAKKYGVSFYTISKIKTGKLWPNVR